MNKIHKMNRILAQILILISLENSPFQEGVMSKTFKTPDKSFFQNPTELGDLINKASFIHKYLPKQTDKDKILGSDTEKIVKRYTSAHGG